MASIMNASILEHPERDPIRKLLRVQLPLLFTITPFTIWKGILCKGLNIILTFSWNFMDLFIMMTSVGLSSLFRQLNENLLNVDDRVINYKFLLSFLESDLSFHIYVRR